MNARKNLRLLGGSCSGILFTGPAAILLVAFVLWPAVYSVGVSCTSWTGFTPNREWVGDENYSSLLRDRRFWMSVGNTTYFLLVGGICHFGLAFFFTATVTHPSIGSRRLLQVSIIFPTFIAVSGVAILWALLYDPHSGLINRILTVFGGPRVIWLHPRSALNAVIACSLWAGVGGHVLILLAGVHRIPSSALNAARLDGASEWSVFTRIVIPMLKPTTRVAIALWIIGAIQLFGLIQTLAGPDLPAHLESMSTYQYAIAFNSRDNIYMMGRGSAIAVVQAVLSLLSLALLYLVFRTDTLEY